MNVILCETARLLMTFLQAKGILWSRKMNEIKIAILTQGEEESK